MRLVPPNKDASIYFLQDINAEAMGAMEYELRGNTPPCPPAIVYYTGSVDWKLVHAAMEQGWLDSVISVTPIEADEVKNYVLGANAREYMDD